MKNCKTKTIEFLNAFIYLFNRKEIHYPLSIIHYSLSIIHFKNYVKSSNSTRRQRTKRA